MPSHQTKDRASKPYAQAGKTTFQPGTIKLVMAGSGCESREKVEQVQKVHSLFMFFLLPEINNLTCKKNSLLQILEQVNGDVGAAIEFLIAEQGAEECSSNSNCLPSQASTTGNVYIAIFTS